jgi:hypothetical protein
MTKMVTLNLTLKVPHFCNTSKPVITGKDVFYFLDNFIMHLLG